jgi:tRNA pseudouridine55 synthase
VDGIFNIVKPAGITSMDVVRRIKRASRQKRVGHAGTLDPIATGVLLVCLGQATRMMEYLIDGTKEYRGEIELGVNTDTYDAVGVVTRRREASSVTREGLDRALGSFTGNIGQVPPMYSALKQQGKRLYELARSGIEVERLARRVQVQSISVSDWSPPVVTVDVVCGRGFYMRSLAHDLGEVLGCGGNLKSLVRLGSGPFRADRAIALDEAEQKLADGTWRDALYAPDSAVGYMRAVIVGERLEAMIRHGQPVPEGIRIPSSRPDERCRAYALDGRFLAVLSFNAPLRQWQPERVFSLAYS